MKKKPPVMPHRIEWDFDKVPSDQYAEATLYEYARESEPLSKSICAWLQTPCEGETRAEKLFQALKKGDENAHQDIVWSDFFGGLEAARQNGNLFRIITLCPHFPRPFLFCGRSVMKITRPLDRDRPAGKPPFSRVRIDPISEIAKRITQAKRPEGMTEMDYMQRSTAFKHGLMINWRQGTVKAIIRDFAKWVSKEAKKHPELKSRGKRGQVSAAPLIWLSALRISKAGIPYEKAKPLLAPTNKLSPYYSDKTGWSRAIKKAEKLLQDLEAGKRIVVL